MKASKLREATKAFAAGLDKQWPASLRPTGSAKLPIGSPAHIHNSAAQL